MLAGKRSAQLSPAPMEKRSVLYGVLTFGGLLALSFAFILALVSVPFGSAAHGMVLKAMQDRSHLQVFSTAPAIEAAKTVETPAPKPPADLIVLEKHRLKAWFGAFLGALIGALMRATGQIRSLTGPIIHGGGSSGSAVEARGHRACHGHGACHAGYGGVADIH